MNDINPISNSASVNPPSGPAGPDVVRSQPRPTPAPEVKSAPEPKFDIPNYTVRYHVQGHQISVRILDDEGRLVRTVPASELLKALQQDNLAPRVNFLG